VATRVLRRCCNVKLMPAKPINIIAHDSAHYFDGRCATAKVVVPIPFTLDGASGRMSRIRTGLVIFIAAASMGVAASATPQQPEEPVALPPAVEQGVDMVYVDPEIAGNIRWRNTKLDDVTFARYAGAPLDLIQAINPLYADLRRGLVDYQKKWGALPQFTMSAGPALTIGSQGERVTLLRERLGLTVGSRFDEPLSKRVAEYEKVHGLKADGVAGDEVIASLNLGADHYEHVVMINMERARRLPAPGELKRHIVVNARSRRRERYADANDGGFDSLRQRESVLEYSHVTSDQADCSTHTGARSEVSH
jgi:hypothetical protein